MCQIKVGGRNIGLYLRHGSYVELEEWLEK